MVAHLVKVLGPPSVSFFHELPALCVTPILGMIASMGARLASNQVFSEYLSVVNPFQHPRRGAQRHHGISTNAQSSMRTLCILPQHSIHSIEHLLHHRILPQIIGSGLDQLLVLAPIRASTTDNFWTTYT